MQPLKAEINRLSTNDLEAYIDTRYEARAPQAELEALETAFTGRVSEDEINMTEEEPNMAEAWDMGVDLEEWLAYEYYRYLHPETEWGGREESGFFNPTLFNDFLSLNIKPSITRQDILEAAKDIYQYKTQLIQRQKSKLKLSHIPTKLSKLYKTLDKKRPQDDNTN